MARSRKSGAAYYRGPSILRGPPCKGGAEGPGTRGDALSELVSLRRGGTSLGLAVFERETRGGGITPRRSVSDGSAGVEQPFRRR